MHCIGQIRCDEKMIHYWVNQDYMIIVEIWSDELFMNAFVNFANYFFNMMRKTKFAV